MNSFLNTSFRNKVIILSLAVSSASYTPIINSFGIWFQHPILLCPNKDTGEFTRCSNEIMCKYHHKDFKIDYLNSPKSFTLEFNLLCERESLRRLSNSIIVGGGLLGCILGIILNSNKSNRKYFFVFTGFANSLFSILPLFIVNFYFISIMLSFSTGCYLIFLSNFTAYFNENYDSKLSDFSILFLNFSFGFIGGIYPIIAYFVNSDWKILFAYIALISIVPSFLLIFFDPDTNSVIS